MGRGLETLQQLVLPDGTLAGVGPMSMVDHPALPWRGLAVDTSHHFLPLETLLRTLDAMAASKLNVLQWRFCGAAACSISLHTLGDWVRCARVTRMHSHAYPPRMRTQAG